MIVPKEILAKHLENIINEIYIRDVKTTKEIYKFLKQNHKMPLDRAQQMMTLKSSLSTFDIFDLFCIAEAIEELGKIELLQKYFSKKEIADYKKEVYNVGEIKNPYVIDNVIKIKETQYFSKMDAIEFYKLNNAAMINYNERTQRVMKRVINHGEEYYKISINRQSVNEIKKLMLSNMYFPDPITLNIPQDGDGYADYNEDEHKLIIHDIGHFDILDGYHRFVAMMELMSEKPDFNYIMEVRISEWSESQAQQFIFQQDQKTKMSIMDAKSFDQNALATRIVDRLNISTGAISGKIGRSGNLIATNDIFAAINKVFTKNIDPSSKQGRQLVNTLVKEISDTFDVILDDDGLSSIKFDYKTLYIIMRMIYAKVDINKFNDVIKDILEKTKDIKYYPSDVQRKFPNIIDEILGINKEE